MLTIATIPGSNVVGSIEATQVYGQLENANIEASRIIGYRDIPASTVIGSLVNAVIVGPKYMVH